MKQSKLAKTMGLATAVGMLCLPGIVFADTEFKGRTEKVNYSDLNIDKKEGAEALYRRLKQASKRVCGLDSIRVTGGVREISQSRACYRKTLDEAVAEVENEELNSIHEG